MRQHEPRWCDHWPGGEISAQTSRVTCHREFVCGSAAAGECFTRWSYGQPTVPAKRAARIPEHTDGQGCAKRLDYRAPRIGMTVKCQWPVSNVDHPVIKGADPTTGHPVDQPRDVAHHRSARCARSPLLDREFTTSPFVFHENTETALLRRVTKVSIAAPC
jgi:hypothetical protein